MDNREIAEVLQTIGSILEIKDENPFKVRAYLNAARALTGTSEDVKKLVAEKRLREIPGIGPAIEEKIVQLVTTGRLESYEALRKEVPAGVLELLRVPSLGAKKARVLWKELGITSLEALQKACEDNKLLTLKGFGEKTQKKILQGICFKARHQGEFLLSEALPLARGLLDHLRSSTYVEQMSLAGSLRRWKEVVRDIDLLAGSARPAEVMEHFLRAGGVSEILAKGETKTSVRLYSGIQVDLRVVSEEQFPYALAYFTGSKEHNVALRQHAQRRGLKVNEYGIFKGEKLLRCKTEEEFFEQLGLPFIPPEMRENTGELDLKESIQLIGPKSLKGVFHTHSTWSDGSAEIEEMAEKARSLGLRYMGLSDHSKAAFYANGMDEERLARQMAEVDRLNRKWRDFRILKGLECDILPTGDLDLTPEILGKLDFVVGSIHSRFDMSQEEMTRRVCKALANEHLDILGHPTGRLLLSREGYRIDLDRVIETARKHRKVIELNAYPNRLDLDWIHCRRAKEQGVMLSINPDAHSPGEIENIEYGVGIGRRGWLEEKDVLNTRDVEGVLEILNG
jgi:DNA polymerase (family 10)